MRVILPELLANTKYAIKLRSRNGLEYSAWSRIFYFQTGGDTTPPPVPDPPTLTAKLGAITIEWNGLLMGGDPPLDFVYVEVHRSTVAGFQPTEVTLTDTMRTAGMTAQGNLEYNIPYYYKLVSVDYSGNRSNPSAEATATVVPLVQDIDYKIGDGTVKLSQLAPGANGAPPVVDASWIVANSIGGAALANGGISAAKIADEAVTAAKIAPNAISAVKLEIAVANSITSAQTQADLGVSKADTAKIQADLGVANAVAAQTQANLGITNAATAQTAANAAAATAATAQTQANTAATSAATALTAANTATTSAAAAQTVANQGVIDAAAAQTIANQSAVDAAAASTAAGNALGTATAATTAAATAVAQADQAVADALAAKNRADLGVANAATAQTAANAAAATAATAQTQADLAVANANVALTTANTRNKIYYQIAEPTGGAYNLGDIWYDTNAGYIMYVYNGTAFVASPLGTDAIADLAINTNKIADFAVNNAKIFSLDAGKITTGYINAARIDANTITASMIVSGTITAAQIAGLTITGDKIAANAITANNIAANAITAAKIAANAITADKISIISSGMNLFANSSFEVDSDGDGLADYWAKYNNAEVTEPTTVTRTPGRSSGLAQRIAWTVASTSIKGLFQPNVRPRAAAVPHVLSVWARGNVTVPGGLAPANNSPATTVTLVNPNLSATVWQQYSWKMTWAAIPETNQFFGYPGAGTGWVEFDDVQIVEGDVIAGYSSQITELLPGTITTGMIAANAIAADKIVANAITADKIAANAITSDKIIANGIIAGKIAAGVIGATELAANSVIAGKIAANAVQAFTIEANAVTADKIEAGAITASKIFATALDSQTITGAVIRTGATGARVHLDIWGLYSYSASGALTAYLPTNGTNAMFAGNIYADQFRSMGANLGSYDYIEVGRTTSPTPDTVDEIRMFTYGTVTSIRNPGDSPGAIRFSLNGKVVDILETGEGLGHVGFRTAATMLKFLGGAYVVQVRNRYDSGYAAVHASAFTLASEMKFKNNVSKIDKGDPLKVIKDNGMFEWDWKTDSEDPLPPAHGSGIIADYLPPWMREGDGYNVGSAIGLLWEATKQIDARLAAIENKK